MRSENYFLRKHVFLCTAGDLCIFLDLKRDRYVAANIRSLPAVHNSAGDYCRVEGLAGNSPPANSSEQTVVVDELAAADLITPDIEIGKPFLPTVVQRATNTLPRLPRRQALLTCQYLLPFLTSARRAHNSLSESTIDDIVAQVERTKRLHHASNNCSFDYEKATALLTYFDFYRPLFPRSYLCLFDSLALMGYLFRYGLYATWVFGVIPEPFEAHCWVQVSDVVLNDTPDHVGRFTPIMAV